jgi:hypothetical protein
MGLIILGQTKTPIGVNQTFCRCNVCEKETWSDLMVESVYIHLYYLPVFPVDKLANLICEECGNKRYGLPFSSRVVSNYEEVKTQFRHPLRMYMLSGMLGLFILIAIIVFNLER